MNVWTVTDRDRELFDRELDSFVPERIFDAHAHLFCTDHFAGDSAPPLAKGGPKRVGYDAFQKKMGELTPGRAMEGLFFPWPSTDVDSVAANAFLYEEMRNHPGSRGQMLVTPKDDPEFIREAVRRYSFVGLKCYHVYAPNQPTIEAPIEDYLPESHIRIAHEESLSITLHIVRPRALADTANQETIRRYCQTYPNMRMILAHAARGFNPHHTILGIESLRGLSNVWFDTSAVTDSGAFEAIVRTMGHERLLYGADFPVSHLRGRCVALGNEFFWISPDNIIAEADCAQPELSLVGHESLRTLKVAALSLNLTDSQVEDIFHNNSEELFNLPPVAHSSPVNSQISQLPKPHAPRSTTCRELPLWS
jgi:predicted TIM-barrel fold metal-dependent hydrolase